MKKNCILFLMMSLVSLASWAMSPLEKHLLYASQGMSDFYMFQLSDGDQRYFKKFQKHQALATHSEIKIKGIENLKLTEEWRSLNSGLQKIEFKNEEVFVAGVLRRQYREYLTNLYLAVTKESESENSQEEVVDKIQFLTAMLGARTLDVVSDYYGSGSLTDHDNLFEAQKVTQQVSKDISWLMSQEISQVNKSSLRKFNLKFNFIKKNLVDHQSQTPYFLIYKNMNSMHKLLTENSFEHLIVSE